MKFLIVIYTFLLVIGLMGCNQSSQSESKAISDPANISLDTALDALKRNDLQQAVPALKKYSEKGDPTAELRMGILYTNGYGVERNTKLGIELLERSAGKGKGDAFSQLGYIYRNGIGVEKNKSTAVSYFLKGIELGSPSAKINYAYSLLTGEGSRKDSVEGLRLAKQSADEDKTGHVYRVLGNWYEAGEVIPKDYLQATQAYEKGAKLGDAFSMYHIAQMLRYGRGYAKDNQNAFKWMKAAADLGNTDAQVEVGYMYEKAIGTLQDFGEAFKYYFASAIHENSMGQFNVGMAYKLGHGVDENKVLAHLWFNLSANSGFNSAKKEVDFLTEKMSTAELSEAHKKAKACLESRYTTCI